MHATAMRRRNRRGHVVSRRGGDHLPGSKTRVPGIDGQSLSRGVERQPKRAGPPGCLIATRRGALVNVVSFGDHGAVRSAIETQAQPMGPTKKASLGAATASFGRARSPGAEPSCLWERQRQHEHRQRPSSEQGFARLPLASDRDISPAAERIGRNTPGSSSWHPPSRVRFGEPGSEQSDLENAKRLLRQRRHQAVFTGSGSRPTLTHRTRAPTSTGADGGPPEQHIPAGRHSFPYPGADLALRRFALTTGGNNAESVAHTGRVATRGRASRTSIGADA